jgi:hypothetical protein
VRIERLDVQIGCEFMYPDCGVCSVDRSEFFADLTADTSEVAISSRRALPTVIGPWISAEATNFGLRAKAVDMIAKFARQQQKER